MAKNKLFLVYDIDFLESVIETVSSKEGMNVPNPVTEAVEEVLLVHGDQGVPHRVRQVHRDSPPPTEPPY